MSFKIKYIAQLCDAESNEIIEQEEIKIKGLSFPKTINEFGIRHSEQIELIKKAQDFFLKFQSQFFSEQKSCPKCGNKIHKKGKFTSDFHDVFTDHEVVVQRLGCNCGWMSDHSIQGIYGNSSHPELVNLQVTNCADKSFDKSSQNLNNICCNKRKINNHATLINNVNKAGTLLEQLKLSEEWSKSNTTAEQIILNIDGGHVQNKEEGKHSFEELVATAYKPEDLVDTSANRKEIRRKVTVASALQDSQKTMKALTKQACLKLGMDKNTIVTVLSDGASNCWNVAEDLASECKNIIKVLDWFHIGKKFKERESKILAKFIEDYNGAKWKLWHGKPNDAIEKLKKLKNQHEGDAATKSLDELISYISNNIDSIVNYQNRQQEKLSFTSQLAESSINSVINDRQKNKKMQWTRKGAHNILQIRTSIFSKEFNSDWGVVSEKLYKKAA